jgi:hypothetical protein
LLLYWGCLLVCSADLHEYGVRRPDISSSIQNKMFEDAIYGLLLINRKTINTINHA